MMLYFKEWNTVIRYTGKDFQIGDKVYLREWNKDTGYTGREIRVVITCINKGEFEEDGTCLMSAECVQYIDTRSVWKRFIDWLHFVKEENPSNRSNPIENACPKKPEFPNNKYCDI